MVNIYSAVRQLERFFENNAIKRRNGLSVHERDLELIATIVYNFKEQTVKVERVYVPNNKVRD